MVTRQLQRPIGDQIAFLRGWRREFHTTGAIAPSSRFLARAITRPIEQRSGPVRILEVGPGTGAVTRRIVQLLRPDDRLDLVELNNRFAAIIERKFREEPLFRKAADQSQIHVCAVEDFQSDGDYDFIISGLPLNNFSADGVREIFDVCFRLLAPEGVLSYFEYILLRRLRGVFSRGGEFARLKALDGVLNGYLDTHRDETLRVLANCPPAWVHHLRNRAAGAAAETTPLAEVSGAGGSPV